MLPPILATKLYVPPPRPKLVPRPRLIARLNEGLHCKLSLICAPAGFGKTTLVSEWVAGYAGPVAWLSLDDEENEHARFLAHLIAALQTIAPQIGARALEMLQSPQPPPTEAILPALLNDLAGLPPAVILVLDDYHVIQSELVDQALTFLVTHLPPPLHLVITTREDPQLPLARLRARGQLTELRAADLRFTPAEAAEFLNQVMGLQLSVSDVAALENRTEGWIAGLQLAALSMQGQKDITGFIQSFTGSHRFVLDYLVGEVLQQQSASVQAFLLRTSVLDRLCGPLCEAVLLAPVGFGQAILETIERANLFVVPLDNERRWYRYHHLFAELLRQRLHQSEAAGRGVADLHGRASAWYESQGLELDAFHHAAAAQDVERAERLVEGGGMPLHYRGAAVPVLNWLESLPTAVLDARPSLWVIYASTLMFSGRNTAVEAKLLAAEAALAVAAPDDRTPDLVGRIAAMRATLAVIQNDVDTIIAQSRRALAHLHPDNRPVRTAATWTLGNAYQLQGDRPAASLAYNEVIASGASFGNSIYTLAATVNLGQVQQADNQLPQAAETYRRCLQLAGDPPQRMVCVAYLGLAQIYYEWNELETAAQHAESSLQLARQLVVDTLAAQGVLVARLRLARGDVPGAVAVLAEAEGYVRQHHFAFRMPDVAAAQVLALLRQGQLAAAAQLAETHTIPFSRARVYLAQGDPGAALAALEPVRQRAEAKNWPDEQLKGLVLQALAFQAQADIEPALQALGDALALAEPGGFIRTFVDEGPPMAALLRAAEKRGLAPIYVRRLQAALGVAAAEPPVTQALSEPLSARELEVLGLLTTELSGPEIAHELRVSLNTLRTHTKNIFSKLGVTNRRAAIRRAEALHLP